MKKVVWLLIIVVILGGVMGWYFLQKNEASRAYATETVTRGSIRNSISASGSLAALTTVEIGSQISGNILKLYADFNDEVKEGQLLAKLESSTFDAQLQQAVANLESARAGELGIVAQKKNLQASMLIAKADIQVSNANVRKAEVSVEDSQRNFKRIKELFERRLVSASERDSALTAWELQKASLDAVKAQFESSKTRVMSIEAQMEALEADREGALARIKQMNAQMTVAQINLDRTSIYSPIDGVIISRAVDEGQTVAASLQAPRLFTVAQDLKKMQIDVAVDEADIGMLQTGQQVSFTVDAYKNKSFSGIVDQVRLSPQESASVVTYSVMVGVENNDLLLKPGMTANADIIVGDRRDVLRLPIKAQYFKVPDDLKAAARAEKNGKRNSKEGQATDILPVWVLNGKDTPERKHVQVGISNQEFIEILSGDVKEGEKVIVGIQGESSSSDKAGSSARRGSVRMKL